VSCDGLTVIVPNAALVSGTVINHSQPTVTRRVRVKALVAHGIDLDRAAELMLRSRAHTPGARRPAGLSRGITEAGTFANVLDPPRRTPAGRVGLRSRSTAVPRRRPRRRSRRGRQLSVG
jgi:small-conductance mechanosensitive channel